jgi:hypothetical protein
MVLLCNITCILKNSKHIWVSQTGHEKYAFMIIMAFPLCSLTCKWCDKNDGSRRVYWTSGGHWNIAATPHENCDLLLAQGHDENTCICSQVVSTKAKVSIINLTSLMHKCFRNTVCESGTLTHCEECLEQNMKMCGCLEKW